MFAKMSIRGGLKNKVYYIIGNAITCSTKYTYNIQGVPLKKYKLG